MMRNGLVSRCFALVATGAIGCAAPSEETSDAGATTDGGATADAGIGTDAGTDASTPPLDGGCWTFAATDGWHAAPSAEDLPFDDIAVPTAVDYWELRRGSTLLGSAGTLCPGDADTECPAAFLVRAKAAAEANCSPTGCGMTLSWQEPTRDAVGLRGADAIAFLGTISSESEAILVASISGYTTGNTLHSGVRTLGDGFEVVGTKMTAFCDPMRTERFRLGIAKTGAVTVGCSDVTSETFGVCI